MATFINCTPHNINVRKTDGSIVTFERSGIIARCTEMRNDVEEVNGIMLRKVVFGEVYDLPDPVPGTFYIVSMAVRAALPSRGDLVSPGALMRDGNGQPIGCDGLDIS